MAGGMGSGRRAVGRDGFAARRQAVGRVRADRAIGSGSARAGRAAEVVRSGRGQAVEAGQARRVVRGTDTNVVRGPAANAGRRRTRVLFVCLGNICRSTMAQFVMDDLVRRAGMGDLVACDSAGTSDEERDNPPHHGTVRKLREQGIPVGSHRARRVRPDEYAAWDLIVYMDEGNRLDLERAFGGDPDGKLRKLLSYVSDGAGLVPVPRDRSGHVRDVADPWCTGDFDATFRDVLAGCEGLLASLGGGLHGRR